MKAAGDSISQERRADEFVRLETHAGKAGLWRILGPLALAVYVGLRHPHMKYTKADGAKGREAVRRKHSQDFYVTHGTISRAFGMSRRTVIREMEVLKAAGLVLVTEQRMGRKANRYVLPELTPELVAQAMSRRDLIAEVRKSVRRTRRRETVPQSHPNGDPQSPLTVTHSHRSTSTRGKKLEVTSRGEAAIETVVKRAGRQEKDTVGERLVVLRGGRAG